VLRLFNRRQVVPDDFEGGESGLRLSDEKFKWFLGQYEEQLRAPSAGTEPPSWRDTIRGEIARLKEAVLTGRPGEIYTWRG
jgi:CRISPR/Cas system-associated endonuclease Cas1